MCFPNFASDGQGIAIRLSKQVASSNKRLRQAIKEYNSIQWPPQMSIFPATIDFQEACDPSWHVYFCFDDTVSKLPNPSNHTAVTLVTIWQSLLTATTWQSF